jgi:formate/nitrite transporter FocA (FNT family)
MKAQIRRFLSKYWLFAFVLIILALGAIAHCVYNAAQLAPVFRDKGQPNKFWSLLWANIRYMLSFTDLQ